MAATHAKASNPSSTPDQRTFVLDTSVLLSDPHAMVRFDEHEVVIPVVVVTELEAKRHHPELGYFARTALRLMDELRIQHGRLDAPLPVGEKGGTLRVELNHTDPESLPAGFRLGDNDSRILAVACNFQAEGRNVTLVSKDLPMRVKASACGLDAEEYRAEQLALESGWTGMDELEVPVSDVDSLYEDGVLDIPEGRDFPTHTGLVLLSERGSALGRVMPDQPDPAGPGRPGGLRHPRPVRRAAGRAGPAAGSRCRDHLARRSRRNG
jgi:PhoH-like ATPase